MALICKVPSLSQFYNTNIIISEDKLLTEYNLAKLPGRDTATGWVFWIAEYRFDVTVFCANAEHSIPSDCLFRNGKIRGSGGVCVWAEWWRDLLVITRLRFFWVNIASCMAMWPIHGRLKQEKRTLALWLFSLSTGIKKGSDFILKIFLSHFTLTVVFLGFFLMNLNVAEKTRPVKISAQMLNVLSLVHFQ